MILHVNDLNGKGEELFRLAVPPGKQKPPLKGRIRFPQSVSNRITGTVIAMVAEAKDHSKMQKNAFSPLQFHPVVKISEAELLNSPPLSALFEAWLKNRLNSSMNEKMKKGLTQEKEEEKKNAKDSASSPRRKKSPQKEVPYPYKTARDLIGYAVKHRQSIADVVMANESVFQTKELVDEKLDAVWGVMHASLERGLQQTAPLPGPLQVARRAKRLADELHRATDKDPLAVLDWVTAYAMAVSEENAAGGRVVTAPTNGAAGVIPAVIQYYLNHLPDADPLKVREFLLTAGAVGILYKENASISGAEVGCQGEVGVACSMAAAGLTAVMGGTVEQVENAAEIAMEHNLGLTCDPVAGQVQIPCIERNAIAAVKATIAGSHSVPRRGSGAM